MPLVDSILVALLLSAVLYLVLLYAIWRNRQVRESATRMLALYAAVSLGWAAVQAVQRLGELNVIANLDVFALQRVSTYLLVALAFLFLNLTRVFERKGELSRRGWIAGGVYFAAAVILSENPFELTEQLTRLLKASSDLIGFSFLIAGWALSLAGALFVTLQSTHAKSTPLHRNRNLYWVCAFLLVLAGQLLFLFRLPAPGVLLNTFGFTIGCYAMLTHRLPDLRTFARRGSSFFFIAAIAILLYTVGFFGIQYLGPNVPGFQPWLGAFLLAVLMALLVNPMLSLIQRQINHLLNGSRYDPRQTLSEYSMSISNILDLDYLALVVVGLISDAMEISHGALIIARYDPEPEDPSGEASGGYILRLITGSGQFLPEGRISEKNPVVFTLSHEHHPLEQYDIDLLARFKDMNPAERAWLDSLGMDVFVPIYARDAWIGLLALGPKNSRERYYDDDLSLLQTLADQTAIALENARLYEDLKQRNTENEILNLELKQANVELARLDEAKSDFINIASHELRTPLTQVMGYNEILNEMIKANDFDSATGKQMVDGVRRAARRLEEIVETMFDVSKLESRTLDLSSDPVQLTRVINSAIDAWTKGVEERKQTITVHGIASLPPITGDHKRLIQVFTNLIQNSIKYTPDGGHIRITGRLVEPDRPGQGETDACVEVIVEDNGIGIAQDDLERIFQKFYRVGNVLLHSTGETKFKGAGPGLGLTIARGIIEAHGGRIWVESPGHDESRCPGAKFHVTLPVRAQSAAVIDSPSQNLAP